MKNSSLLIAFALICSLGGLSACKKDGQGFTPFKKMKAKREARKNPYANNPYEEYDAQQAAHGASSNDGAPAQTSSNSAQTKPPAEPDIGPDPRYDAIETVEDRVRDAAKRHNDSFNTDDGSFTSQARKREPAHVLGSTNPVDSGFSFSGLGNLSAGDRPSARNGGFRMYSSARVQRDRVNRFTASGPRLVMDKPEIIRDRPPRESQTPKFGLGVDYNFLMQ